MKRNEKKIKNDIMIMPNKTIEHNCNIILSSFSTFAFLSKTIDMPHPIEKMRIWDAGDQEYFSKFIRIELFLI